MNHCLLEVTVQAAPTIRYTQDNKTAIAEMNVSFDGLRADDPPGLIKVVGWGNLAQELPNRVQVGQRLVLEGRLRMNTVPRQDGTKEKKAEFTLAKIHTNSQNSSSTNSEATNAPPTNHPISKEPSVSDDNDNSVTWDSSPLVPDTDNIPF